MRIRVRRLGAGVLLAAALGTAVGAQTPQGTAFTYQGRLTESGALATGAYDLQFVLYDDPAAGAEVGPPVAMEDVAVSEGLFTVRLDFGAVFGGERRWLELRVRPGADTGPFTPILPRQELSPGPFAIFSAAAGDSLSLGGVPASQFVQTDDPRLSDPRVPLPGSPDYVQNGSAPQPGASFNVEGTGAAGVLEAQTQFNLGGTRILSSPGTHNLFAGANAGASNTTGEANAFFGTDAGVSNTTGGSNSFFGFNSGYNTTISHNNSFFGDAAGYFNTTGEDNSFYGFLAGFKNTTASLNAFFGAFAGSENTTGTANAFFGEGAGGDNTIGSANSFVGRNAGAFNSSGSFNTFVGEWAGIYNDTGYQNTYIGSKAGEFMVGNSNTFVGMGAGGVATNATGSSNTLLGALTTLGNQGLAFATAIGAGAVVGTTNTVVLGRPADTVRVPGSQTVGGSLQAMALDVATQYSIGGQRVLGGLNNLSLFVGPGTGSGALNTFVGTSAGRDNTSGANNAFLGHESGAGNVAGSNNSFLGSATGRVNAASNNSFFGFAAGAFNTSGASNAFLGGGAGNFNTTGQQNVFVGESAGSDNATGSENTFVGRDADWGGANPIGNANTLLGASTRAATGVSNATAIGSRARVTQSNSVVIGGIGGVNNGVDTQVGIGTTAPGARFHVRDNGADVLVGGSTACPGYAGVHFGTSITCQNYAILGGDGSTYVGRPAGGTLYFKEGGVEQASLRPGGALSLQVLSGGGGTFLCRNPANEIAFCSSSLRYKTDVAPFGAGLEVVERLRPIRFTWKANGRPDIGLGAEEVAEVEPLLAFRNGDGDVEGVNYAQLGAVLVNAVQQQQERLRRQEDEIAALRALLCELRPGTTACLPEASR